MFQPRRPKRPSPSEWKQAREISSRACFFVCKNANSCQTRSHKVNCFENHVGKLTYFLISVCIILLCWVGIINKYAVYTTGMHRVPVRFHWKEGISS